MSRNVAIWIARWHQMEARRAAGHAMTARAIATARRWSLDWWCWDRKAMGQIANDWDAAASMHAQFARVVMGIDE